MWTPALSLLVFTASMIHGAQSACTAFQEIAESNYDRNYSSINTDSRRPLGFMKGTVPFNDPDVPNVCVTLNGVSGRHLAIAFETVPKTTLCVRDQAGDRGCMESYSDCYRATADTMTFTFYCERSEGCSESDVTFWYRLTRGPPPEEDTEDTWCDNRGDVIFPEALAPPPPNLIPPTIKPETPVGASCRLSAPLSTLLGLLLLFVLV